MLLRTISIAVSLAFASGCALRGADYQPESCVFAADADAHEAACGEHGACAYRFPRDSTEATAFCRPAMDGREGTPCDADHAMCAPGYHCFGYANEVATCVRFCRVDAVPSECPEPLVCAGFERGVLLDANGESTGLCL